MMNTLHTQSTSLFERLLNLERCGRYKEALAEIKHIWADLNDFPDVTDFETQEAAEIYLRCGNLIGLLGQNVQIPDAQEKSKDLLMEAYERFLSLGMTEKIAECENYLALAYWRKGELREAETFVETALAHALPAQSKARLYAHITKSLIHLEAARFAAAAEYLENQKLAFQHCDDAFLRGSYSNNLGIVYQELHNLSEALKNFELARYYFQKARHQIYLGTVENNLAQLYKRQNRFTKAHESIDRATRIFRGIKDRLREGFSFDTKAQIYFAEKEYADALKMANKAIAILDKGENKAYLVETFQTKVKTLIYLDDFPAATFCLFEAVQIAKTHISEEAADKLVKEYEATVQEKNSIVIGEIFTEQKSLSESLELLMPSELAHYNDIHGFWIKNNHLASIGLAKDCLAVVAREEVRRGDLVAIVETAEDLVSCGFYDSDFGIVCLEGLSAEPQLFDETEIRVLGKIIGVCRPEKNAGGKLRVEALRLGSGR